MRALAKKRRIIHVCPQGIPAVELLSAEQLLALAENRLLLISPQPGGSLLNKKVATWAMNMCSGRHGKYGWEILRPMECFPR